MGKKWPDFLLAAVAALAEVLAMRYGATPLAWLACILFWFAIWDFTRPFLKHTCSKIIIPIMAAAVLIAGTVVLLHGLYSNKPGPPQLTPTPAPAPVIKTQLKGACQQVADGSELMKWSKKYKVGFVCGLIDPTQDPLDDDRISVSKAYTISPHIIPMAVPFSPLMLTSILKKWKEVGEGIKAGSVPNEVPAGVPILTWEERVLLPKTAKFSGIHRLSDIRKHGGVILSQVDKTK